MTELVLIIAWVLDEVGAAKADILISGASGAHAAVTAEKSVLSDRSAAQIRAFAGQTGHMKEAQFPFAVALAAISVANGEGLPPLDPAFEKPASGRVESAVALTVGYHRGEGAALLAKA